MLMSIGFLALLLGGYVLFQSSDVIFGPKLHVFEPMHGAVFSGAVVVRGETDPRTAVSVNGFLVTSDEEGIFEEQIPLQKGAHEVHIIVENRFGRQAREVRQIMVK